jgi:hypothetical protein
LIGLLQKMGMTMMDRIAIHTYLNGKFHPKFGGKAANFDIVSGANPIGPRGGRNGTFVDGKVRWSVRTSPTLLFVDAQALARSRAIEFAVTEGLEFIAGDHVPVQDHTETSGVESIDPHIDSRVRRLMNTVVRPKQAKFRSELVSAYAATCCLSSEAVIETLQAAHIRPHLGAAQDCVQNGLLLRADLHILFDNHLIGIDSNLRIVVSPRLSGTIYEAFSGARLRLPSERSMHPNLAALRWHYEQVQNRILDDGYKLT